MEGDGELALRLIKNEKNQRHTIRLPRVVTHTVLQLERPHRASCSSSYTEGNILSRATARRSGPPLEDHKCKAVIAQELTTGSLERKGTDREKNILFNSKQVIISSIMHQRWLEERKRKEKENRKAKETDVSSSQISPEHDTTFFSSLRHMAQVLFLVFFLNLWPEKKRALKKKKEKK